MNGDVVDFDKLAGSDLVLDCVYRGGTFGGTQDDPLSKLLPVGNQGGFRIAGSTRKDSVKLTVLYTTGSEPDWPDALDPYTGTFTYYGDNRRPARCWAQSSSPRSATSAASPVPASWPAGPG